MIKRIIEDLEICFKIESNKLSISVTNAPGSSIANDTVDVGFDIDLEDIKRLISMDSQPSAGECSNIDSGYGRGY